MEAYMGTEELVGIPLSGEKAKQLYKDNVVRQLKEWIRRKANIKVCTGPGEKELALAVLEPRMDNGKMRAFNFVLVQGGKDISINCRFRTVEGMDKNPEQDRCVELVCVLDKDNIYLFHGTYNFHSREGWLGVLLHHN